MRRMALVATLIFVIDQITKLAVVFGLDLKNRHEIDVLPPLLNFRMAWNQGVNFGLLSSASEFMRWFIIVMSLVITAWVWIWIRRGGHGRWMQISAGVLIGGALGNVVDRVAYGAVADFLNMTCCGFENPYAFNVADIAIFAGAFGLVIFGGKDRGPKTAGNKAGGKPAVKPGAKSGQKAAAPRRKTP
ncbi:signal peptidase II [Gemmobacter serpentinus]|uniref:signal peptidase II n=1 Tax=Gemmobacter serpentinus TaxID=2652247 RepID=UPI00124DDAF3|nr:signal peptidase II [Gemmobacter serpentinus]